MRDAVEMAFSRFGSYTSQIAPMRTAGSFWNTVITNVPRLPLPITPRTTWSAGAAAWAAIAPAALSRNIRLFDRIAFPLVSPQRADDLIRCDRGRPVFLDVFDHELRSALVAHERAPRGIVHGVGQIANQNAPLAPLRHLPDRKRAVQDAQIRVNAGVKQRPDAAGPHRRINLASAVRDQVARPNLDRGVFSGPIAIVDRERIVRGVAAAIGIVDGQARGGDLARNRRRGGWNREDAPSLRRSLIIRHRFRRRVDDEKSPGPREMDDRGDPARQNLDAFGRSLDRKSTRLNSSHVKISYAVFCLKKKKKKQFLKSLSTINIKNNTNY